MGVGVASSSHASASRANNLNMLENVTSAMAKARETSTMLIPVLFYGYNPGNVNHVNSCFWRSC